MPKAHNVIARYGNFFQGDDDFFTHCLILDNGECWLLPPIPHGVPARKRCDSLFYKILNPRLCRPAGSGAKLRSLLPIIC